MPIMGESVRSRAESLYAIYASEIGIDTPWEDLSIVEQRGWRDVAVNEEKRVSAVEQDYDKLISGYKFEMSKMVPTRHYTGVVAAIRTCRDIMERLVVMLEAAVPPNETLKDGRIILGGLETIIELSDMNKVQPYKFEPRDPINIDKRTRTWYD